MFGNKSFLRIGKLSDASISGLYQDSYELESCQYSFSQGTDFNGKPQTDVRGGVINICYAGLPKEDLLYWMLKPGRLKDGAIVICNENDEPLEKVFFEQAACVSLAVDYAQQGTSYISTKITLQAQKIKVGEMTLTNPWTTNN